MLSTLKRRILPLGGVALLALAGCGGGHAHRPTIRQQVHAQVAHVEQASAQQCNTSDYAMQCRLATIPPALQPHTAQLARAATSSSVLLHGKDFAWTKLSPGFAGDFGASYISNDPSKDWNPGLVAQYHAAHKGTVAVYETTADRAAAGCSTGAADARYTEHRLNSWGYQHAHFDMAVDFDANLNQVVDYFRCANATEPGLVGAYASAYIVNRLCSLGYAHKSWPTYAWLYRTAGVWPSIACGPLRQVLNGNAFDNDIALATDYGQFPTPIVGESAAVKATRKAREAAFAIYHTHRARGHVGCLYPQADPECRIFGSKVIADQAILWKTYPRWALFGPRVTKKGLASEVAFVVRPEVAYWSHARDASRRAFDAHVCGGATGTQALTKDCKIWKQRADWFGAHATATVNEYSRT